MMLNTVKLSEVSDVVDSLHKSPQYSGSGFPMVRVTDVKRGYLDISGCNLVSEEIFKEFNRKYTPKSGDIIMTRVGTYGVSALVGKCPPFCLGQNTVVIEPKKIDSRLLYHYLQSSFVKNQIEQQVVGSTQKTLSLKAINNLEIPIFDKNTENYINTTLSSIDDKIHTNNKISETLELTAKTIFKEWFIDCGPVKAKVEGKKPFGMDDETASLFSNNYEDSEIGKIPKGWKYKKLNELIETISETYQFAPDEKVVFLNTSDILKGEFLTSELSDSSSLPGQAKKRITKGDILYSEIRPANGRYAFVHFDSSKYVVSTKLMVLRSKKIDPVFLYFYLTRDEFVSEMQRLAETRSGTFPQITFEVLGSREILMPDELLLEEFLKILRLIHEQRINLILENKQLEKTRDLLLPKLISGEISLNDV